MRTLGIIALGLGLLIGGSSAETREAPKKCDRSGSVHIGISGQTLDVPRIVLGTIELPDRVVIFCGGHDDGADYSKALAVGLSANRTWGGDKFYEDWIATRKLPTQILINAAGWIKYDHQYKFASLLKRGFEVRRNDSGLEFVDARSRLYVLPLKAQDGSSEKLFVDCQKTEIIHGGHSCTVLYRYGLFDLRYRFVDKYFPQNDWIDLDKRVRAFIQSIIVKN